MVAHVPVPVQGAEEGKAVGQTARNLRNPARRVQRGTVLKSLFGLMVRVPLFAVGLLGPSRAGATGTAVP
ncbi:MAG TPA: hypothetical protein VEY08_02795, partial [Chloroflexia bacterium]|nr:hypothetical protein [Chloroflexia bacterium]